MVFVFPVKFQQGIVVAELTLIPIRRRAVNGKNTISVSLWSYKIGIGIGMWFMIVPASIPGHTTPMVRLRFWTGHFLYSAVVDVLSFLSVWHKFRVRIWTLMSSIHTRNVVLINRQWIRAATDLAWDHTTGERAWRAPSTVPAASRWAATSIITAALLTYLMGMSPMSTTTVIIYIVTILMTPVFIPAVATEVIRAPAIIPIIVVIITAVTVLSVPIKSIVLAIPNLTVMVVATSI